MDQASRLRDSAAGACSYFFYLFGGAAVQAPGGPRGRPGAWPGKQLAFRPGGRLARGLWSETADVEPTWAAAGPAGPRHGWAGAYPRCMHAAAGVWMDMGRARAPGPSDLQARQALLASGHATGWRRSHVLSPRVEAQIHWDSASGICCCRRARTASCYWHCCGAHDLELHTRKQAQGSPAQPSPAQPAYWHARNTPPTRPRHCQRAQHGRDSRPRLSAGVAQQRGAVHAGRRECLLTRYLYPASQISLISTWAGGPRPLPLPPVTRDTQDTAQ